MCAQHIEQRQLENNMVPMKRTLDDRDAGHEEVVGIESATSALRTSLPQKRIRIALAQDDVLSVVSGEDESAGVASESENGWHASRDSVPFNEEDDDDINEFRATQAVEKQIRQDESRLRDNIAFDYGVIEEVFCRNFMCHSKLRVRLGPNINFIIGHNGSGKSAVLTAIQMCLGGKAQATNRATNLKGMIKEGEESAVLAVKIKNRGDDAYRPELYGQSITVERHFSRAGTSGFKIKSDQDKTVSTKKADLDDILDYFAFQLDNPINVLSQDNARQFLSNSSAADKYKFFIRGTQLEALDADYKLLEEHLDNMEVKLGSRKEDVDVLKGRANEAEKKKKASDQIATIEDKIKRLQWMHAWAQVEETEAAVAAGEKKVEDAKNKVQEKKDSAEDTAGIYEGHSQALETTKSTLSDLQGQLIPVQEHHKSEKDAMDDGSKNQSNMLSQQRSIKENLKATNNRVRKREDEIKEEQQRLADAEGPEQAARLVRLEELKGAVEEAQRERDEFRGSQTELQQLATDAKEAINPATAATAQARETVRKAEVAYEKTKNQQPNPYAGYPPNMARLVQAVRQETRWRTKPVGPMGAHVKLLDEKWMSPIEKTFGAALNSFVVFCKEDSDILSQIMRRVGCQAGAIIGNAIHLDTSDKEPERNVKTILRALEIDNEAVRNQLIINHAIEQTVLIADRNEAYNYMYGSSRPRNVRSVVCFLNTQRNQCLRFDYTRFGSEKSGPVNPFGGATRMKSDHEAQVRIQQNHVDNAKREREAAEVELRRLQAAKKGADQELERYKRRQHALVVAVQGAEDAVEALQNEIESSRPRDGKLQELQKQQAEDKHELESIRASFSDSVLAKDALNQKQGELRASLQAAEKELEQMKARVEETQRRVDQLELDRTTALREKNLAFQYVQAAEEEVKKADEFLTKERENLVYMDGEASKITPHGRVSVEPGATPKTIDDRLAKLIADAQAQERRVGGTREELTLAYHSAVTNFQEAEAQMKSLETLASVSHKYLRFLAKGTSS